MSKAKLYQKILNVVSNMEAVEKSGYNNHQKYSYSTEEDLVNGIRKLLVSNKLIVLTSSETKEILKLNKTDKNASNGLKETLVAVVNTKHKIIDVETGEFEEVTSTATGWDDTDKMTFKAITGALKYFIGKNFLVPSKDDAENDGLPKEQQPVQQVAPKTFNKPTPVKVAPVVTETVLVKVEEPKEELIKPATVVAPTASATNNKVFQRRTTLNSNKEPNF